LQTHLWERKVGKESHVGPNFITPLRQFPAGELAIRPKNDTEKGKNTCSRGKQPGKGMENPYIRTAGSGGRSESCTFRSGNKVSRNVIGLNAGGQRHTAIPLSIGTSGDLGK